MANDPRNLIVGARDKKMSVEKMPMLGKLVDDIADLTLDAFRTRLSTPVQMRRIDLGVDRETVLGSHDRAPDSNLEITAQEHPRPAIPIRPANSHPVAHEVDDAKYDHDRKQSQRVRFVRRKRRYALSRKYARLVQCDKANA